MEYLNLEQIGAECPSALTQTPSRHLSHIYKHIPTTRVIDILEEKNWKPTAAMQTRTRTGSKRWPARAVAIPSSLPVGRY